MKWMPEFTTDHQLLFKDETGGRILPNPISTFFQYGEYRDRSSDYGPFQCSEREGVFSRKAVFYWNDISFQSCQEWFIAPMNPNLLVFRQTLEASEDCCYHLETCLETPDTSSGWSSYTSISQEDNSCGLTLEADGQILAALCETTQLVSSSVRITECRTECRRSYEVTAWKETPVKLEKYMILQQSDQKHFQELAFAECRLASRLRFDALLEGKAVHVILPEEEQ